MNFNSFEFLIYLAVVLVLYFILPLKFRWIMLLVASYYFYMSWNASLIFLILGTTLVSYLAAIFIEKSEKKSIKKLWLILTLVVCLGVLAFFKYANFFIGSVIDFLNLFKMNLDGFALNILLPVGISFYTFQTLSYVIDVYRGEYKAEKHFGYYALFVSYFPQLVAGPIERFDNLMPQLKQEHKLNIEDMSAGFRIALCGFFFKCVVADCVGIYVNNVFGNLQNANALSVFLAGVLFNVQIYCDFAGYSEIARGVARMMGVKLMKNFDRPFSATSYSELNRRWHISLNQWFTDYVYIPLGGGKKGLAKKCLNILIVFALSGLWHGASWTYVIWGLYAAFFVILESILYKPGKRFCEKHKIDVKSKGVAYLRRALMLPFFVVAGLLFRAQSLGDIGLILSKLFTGIGFGESYFTATLNVLGVGIMELLMIALCLIGMQMMTKFAEHEPKKEALTIKPIGAQKTLYAQKVSVYVYAVLVIAYFWLALIENSDVSSFAYFQF